MRGVNYIVGVVPCSDKVHASWFALLFYIWKSPSIAAATRGVSPSMSCGLATTITHLFETILSGCEHVFSVLRLTVMLSNNWIYIHKTHETLIEVPALSSIKDHFNTSIIYSPPSHNSHVCRLEASIHVNIYQLSLTPCQAWVTWRKIMYFTATKDCAPHPTIFKYI
jgi:hypothetical protein